MRSFHRNAGTRVVRIASVCATFFVASEALATVTTVPVFTGTYSETFESFPRQAVQLFVPNPTPLFGTHATLTVTGSASAVKAIAIYEGAAGPDTFAPYEPSDGTQFAISQDFSDALSITFDQDATKFGGFFGQAQQTGSSVNVPLSFTFLDSLGATVGSGNFVPPGENDSTLMFLGLSSTVPFRTITITPSQPALLLMDGLQVTVPEPTSIAALAIGGVALLKRRRTPARASNA